MNRILHVRRLIAEKVPYGEISRQTGACKSLISYHSKRMGMPFVPRRTYNWQRIQDDIDSGATVLQIVEKHGCSKAAYQYAIDRGAIKPRKRASKMNLAEIITHVHGRRTSSTEREIIRSQMVESGHCSRQCSMCTRSDWNGFPIVLHVDHIDGDPTNNALTNLRLLCPNCHSTTETWGGRNLSKNKTGRA